MQFSKRGQVFDTGSLPDEKKDTAVFILKPPGAAGKDGDLHLKTNLVFDFTMRAGNGCGGVFALIRWHRLMGV